MSEINNEIMILAKIFIESAVKDAINRIQDIIYSDKKLPLSEKERKEREEELPDFNKMSEEERKEQDWGAAKIQASFRGKEARKIKVSKNENDSKKEDDCRSPIPPDMPQPSSSSPRKAKK